MGRVVTSYFDGLFKSSCPLISLADLNMIDKRLTESMIESLLKPFSQEQVVAALASMHPCKSPGPDGCPALFYKQHWATVGDDICRVVLEFLNDGVLPHGLNHTNVVLIPKVPNLCEMKDFRPISLCNVSYKLISKALSNRLKSILPLIIDGNQSAFIPGRLITNTNVLSSKIFHFMNHNQAKKRRYMAMKLDMSKAYDRIEWDFLAGVMAKMGFPCRWIDRVMSCVSSVS